MKVRINLYHREFRPAFEWITAGHLFVLLGLCLLLSGGAFTGLQSWKENVERDADSIGVKLAQEQQIISELTTALQSRADSPLLTAQIDNLQNQMSSKQTLLNKVKGMSELKQKSFSGLFNALADADSNELWISTFTVNETDLNINGSLANPSALTKWISDLSNTEFFRGQEFYDARVVRDNGQLSFELNSSKKLSDVLVAQGGKNAEN